MDKGKKGNGIQEEEIIPTAEAAPPQDANPQLEQEINGYITALSRLLHSKETSGSIMEMLKAGPPEQTIPRAALAVNMQMEQATTKRGKPPSLDILLNAGAFLVNDLVEIGNAAGIFKIETEEQVAPIVQTTFQMYIEKGLKDGTIDPVELQQRVEPLMGEEHKALGMEAASRTGIPPEADQSTAMQAYGAEQRRQGALKGGK